MIERLDFELHYTSPLVFLERYLRLYDLDLIESDEKAKMISMLACLFCRCLLRSKAYLSLKPSQAAAAAFTLAVRVSRSPLVK